MKKGKKNIHVKSADEDELWRQYSWLTTCIYIAVLTVEYPTNWIIQRVPIAKYLAVNIILWGSILAFHAAAKSFAGLVVLRTLLGAFEACCQPIFVVLSSMWYRREEQAQTVAYWYMMNGGQQIVGAYPSPSKWRKEKGRRMGCGPDGVLKAACWHTPSPTSPTRRRSTRGRRCSSPTASAPRSGASLCSSTCPTRPCALAASPRRTRS